MVISSTLLDALLISRLSSLVLAMMEYWLEDVDFGSLPGVIILSCVCSVLEYRNVSFPPVFECIVISRGVVFLCDNLNG